MSLSVKRILFGSALVLAGSPLFATEAAANSGVAAAPRAFVNCPGISNVPMTADAEQALPLRQVATLACGQQVAILADNEGYTAHIRTSEGKEGYVARMYLTTATPAAQPSLRVTPEAIQRLNPFGVAGPWSERLTHFRPDVEPNPAFHLQSEYMVPRARATTAIARLREIGERIDRLLWATEIRSMTGDGLWLSPSFGDDRVAIHFSWRREMEAVAALTAEIEEMLLPLGARPHWGKIIHARAAELVPLYPKLPAFRDLARSYDPGGKFRNEFLDTHVFG